MKYLGIDASTKSTGIALFDDDILISHKCITASSTDVIKRIEKIIKSQKLTDKIILEYLKSFNASEICFVSSGIHFSLL